MKKIFITLAAIFLAGCAITSNLRYPPVRWLADMDRQPIKKPSTDIKQTLTPGDWSYEQVKTMVDLTDQIEGMSSYFEVSSKHEALNTNNFDEVADSTWFTNRIGRYGSSYMLGVQIPPGQNVNIQIVPAELDEKPSGHDVITSAILYAAGYNVPKKAIVYSNGKRAVATAPVEGEPIGTFKFWGRRHDDKNDRIPHEHRRELRGLHVFAALLGLNQMCEKSTLDTFIKSDGDMGYVKHSLVYLGRSPRKAEKIFSPIPLDPVESQWSENQTKKGDASSFNPKTWQTSCVNPAFLYTSKLDGFWASRILLNFSDDLLASIVDQAKFTDPKVQKQMLDELIDRRDKLVNYWFSRVNPLDNFVLTNNNNGGFSVTFDDLATKAKIAGSSSTVYEYRLRTATGDNILSHWFETNDTTATISPAIAQKMGGGLIYMMQIKAKRGGSKWWGPSVNVFVQKTDQTKIIGLRRRYAN